MDLSVISDAHLRRMAAEHPPNSSEREPILKELWNRVAKSNPHHGSAGSSADEQFTRVFRKEATRPASYEGRPGNTTWPPTEEDREMSIEHLKDSVEHHEKHAADHEKALSEAKEQLADLEAEQDDKGDSDSTKEDRKRAKEEAKAKDDAAEKMAGYSTASLRRLTSFYPPGDSAREPILKELLRRAAYTPDQPRTNGRWVSGLVSDKIVLPPVEEMSEFDARAHLANGHGSTAAGSAANIAASKGHMVSVHRWLHTVQRPGGVTGMSNHSHEGLTQGNKPFMQVPVDEYPAPVAKDDPYHVTSGPTGGQFESAASQAQAAAQQAQRIVTTLAPSSVSAGSQKGLRGSRGKVGGKGTRAGSVRHVGSGGKHAFGGKHGGRRHR